MITSEKHQKALLGGVERLAGVTYPDLVPLIPKILMAFYQVDVLEEEVIKQWGTHVSKKYVDKDTSKRVRKASEPFLKVRTSPHHFHYTKELTWVSISILSGLMRRRSLRKSLMTSRELVSAVYPLCFRIWTGCFTVVKSYAPASSRVHVCSMPSRLLCFEMACS